MKEPPETVNDPAHSLLGNELRPDLLVKCGECVVVVMPQVVTDRINENIDVPKVVLGVAHLGPGLGCLGVGHKSDFPLEFVLGDSECLEPPGPSHPWSDSPSSASNPCQSRQRGAPVARCRSCSATG